MSLILDKPFYRCDPIRSLQSLASALRVSEDELIELARLANRSYLKVPPKPGKKPRECFKAKPRLKAVHNQIKEALFAKVEFPLYLTGSIKGRDYVLNADRHKNKAVLICEDVQKFFPSVRAERVNDVWVNFFGFSEEVSALLTKLTTKDGALPQGAITSSFLANLVFFRDEPLLEAKLGARGIDYSRYVDDMAMSSKRRLPNSIYAQSIGDVYGMLRRNGLFADRDDKHKFFRSAQQMFLTNLIVNRKPSLPRGKRQNARTAVFQVERRIANGELTPEVSQLLSKVSHVVGGVRRLHKREGGQLKERIKQMRESVDAQGGIPFITISETVAASTVNAGQLPWE